MNGFMEHLEELERQSRRYDDLYLLLDGAGFGSDAKKSPPKKYSKKLKHYLSLGLCGSETTLKICSYGTMSPGNISSGSFLSRGNRMKNSNPTLDAMRLKKSRLRKNALVIVSLHGSRARFCTATFRFSENLKDKKCAHEKLKYLFKKLKRAGYELEYSGMMERHQSGAFHFHFLAYRVGGVLRSSGEPAWDYKPMQDVAVSLDGNIDIKKLDRSRDPEKKISAYISKLEGVVVAAYMSKGNGAGDCLYTMTSKGCCLPKRKYFFGDAEARRKAAELIEDGGFQKKEGGGFPYYLSKDRNFSRRIYHEF